jgi:hypothetical protein
MVVTTRKTTAETGAAIAASLQPQTVMVARPPPSPPAPSLPLPPPPVEEVICHLPCADINLMPPRLITTVGGPVAVSARCDTSPPVAEETDTVIVAPGAAPPPSPTRSIEVEHDPSAAAGIVTPSPLGATIGEVAQGLTMYRVLNNENQSEMKKKAIGSAVISACYSTRRRQVISDFLDFLKSDCLKYKDLLCRVPTPAHFPTNSQLIENVFVCFSGEKEKMEKIKTLNVLLINWVGNRKLKNATKNKSSPYPQPGTLNMDLCSFFAGTKEYYLWCFGVSNFNFEGGYNGFFMKLMKECIAADVSKNRVFFAIIE